MVWHYETSMRLDTDVTQILELSHRWFTTTMIDILRALIKKIDNMPEQMGNVSRKVQL